MTLGPLLDTRALAERWGVSYGHLANLRSAGLGPPYMRFGRAIRYRVADIEEYEHICQVDPVVPVEQQHHLTS